MRPTIETLGLPPLHDVEIEVNAGFAPGILDEPDDSTSYASVRMPQGQ